MIYSSSKGLSTKSLIITAMFTSIICVLSQIIIPIQPIPFSLSLLAIFLTGALLEPRYAFLSTLAYLLLGAFGLPVFAGFKGGINILTGMTGGFLMAYPLMAFITSLFYQISLKLKSTSSWNKLNHKTLPALGMVISLFICYLIGSLWFSYVADTTISYALTVCVIPFIAFDLLKIIMALSAAMAIKRVLGQVI
ncbi:biotin transporter BioY [Herbinix luporum]|jgi:biotin transport system substrate-specific component|uniref:biotin transporter BioY n=1 Tax=Herbinix luporum TaxID=1679721 RepID=UPI001775105D|nr:biotin transporter BioY [Herbinix luporum]MDI9489153.1 biotin transporter BioY [Bacillota bacterium]HHT57090.1 biotin transporter BioY [Herbinix luporum]